MTIHLRIQNPTRFSVRVQYGALFWAMAVNSAAHGFLMIVIPVLGRRLGFADMQTGVLVGVSALFMAIFGPYWGNVIDSCGWKRVLVVALTLSATFPMALVSALWMTKTHSLGGWPVFLWVFVARVFQAGISAGFNPATQAWFADRTDAKQRAGGLAFMGIAFGIGAIIGGALAWQMDVIPGLCGFALALLISAVIVGLCIQDGKITAAAPLPQKISKDLLLGFIPAIGLLRRLWPYLCTTVCGLTVYSLLMQLTSLRLVDQYGLSLQQAMQESGKIIMLTMVVMIGTQSFLLKSQRMPPLRIVQCGAFCGVVAMATATLAPSLMVFMSGTVAMGFAFGLMLTGNLALMSIAVDSNEQARAAGVNAVAQGSAMAMGPMLGTLLYAIAPWCPYAVGALLLVGICILYWGRRYKLMFTN